MSRKLLCLCYAFKWTLSRFSLVENGPKYGRFLFALTFPETKIFQIRLEYQHIFTGHDHLAANRLILSTLIIFKYFSLYLFQIIHCWVKQPNKAKAILRPQKDDLCRANFSLRHQPCHSKGRQAHTAKKKLIFPLFARNTRKTQREH